MSERVAMQQLGPRDPRVACGGDDAYALPIAVSLRSAADALAADRRLGVYLLDAGISSANRARIEASLPLDRVALQWLAPDMSLLREAPAKGHVSIAAYTRLFLPQLLPAQLERILYLDSDVVVRGDLGELWDLSLAGKLALAVQEVAAPYFDCEKALPDFERCEPYLVATRPIENYEALGLEPQAPYFNSGVMLIDLDGWRRESIAAACFDVLEKHRDFVKFHDQYALNVVLTGRWGPLPEVWNSSTHLMTVPDASRCAFDSQAFERARAQPQIIHFTGPVKPWHPFASRKIPRASRFHEVRRLTPWRGRTWFDVLLREWKVQQAERLRTTRRAFKRLRKPKKWKWLQDAR